MLARLPDQRLSLAVLCNAGDAGPLSVNPLVDLFVPGPDPAAETGGPAATADAEDRGPRDVDGTAGLYFSEQTGEPLRLVARDGELRVDRGPALVAVDEDRFRVAEPRLSFMSEDAFELHFSSPDRLTLTSMEGTPTRYRRAQPDTTAAPIDFVGRYESDELDAVLTVAPEGGGLTIRLNGSPPYTFSPADRDAFQLGRMIARFRRDEAGRVVALDYSNPVLRTVPFARRDDRVPEGDVEGLPAEAEPDRAAPPTSIVEDPTRYAGDYVLAFGPRTRGFRVFVGEGGLMAELEGAGTSRLLPRGEHTFVAEVAPDYRFVFSPNDPARPVTLHVGGREVPGTRKAP